MRSRNPKVSSSTDTMKYYGGIGSRKCPEFAVNLAVIVGSEMYDRGIVLRSGHADGMDKAFERGHDLAQDRAQGEPLKEIWLPEKGFNKSDSSLYNIHPDAYRIAKRIHPNWKACNEFARNAHARNCHQVLGKDLNSPICALLCYTENAEVVGGTATALRLAMELGIPIFNFGDLSQSVSTLIDFIDKVS